VARSSGRALKDKKPRKSVKYSEKQYKALNHYNTLGHAHELTFSCYHRYDYLLDPIAYELFLSKLERSRKEYEFELWAYVLMFDHVHLLSRGTREFQSTMLHFEMYKNTANGAFTQKQNLSEYDYVSPKAYKRRKDLLDPTLFLDDLELIKI